MHGYINQGFVAAYASTHAFLPTARWHPGVAHAATTPLLRPRTLLKCTAPLALISIVFTLLLWQPHVEVAFYARSWVKHEVSTVRPLAGCFSPSRVSPRYNLSDTLYGKKAALVHAGMPLRLGMDCYDFAGTIPPPREEEGTPPYVPPEERVQFHTYWRTDLAPFTERQEWMLKSFFATQNVNASRLVLWSNGDLSGNPILQPYLARYPDAFALRKVNHESLAVGTELEDSDVLDVQDRKAWIDGDSVRLQVLWAHGGVWVDMDSLLTRSIEPLLEHEFVTQWDCYDKLYVPFNGALMHFRQHSPYLCEAFHIMATAPPPRAGSTDWGATLYLKLWRRLVASSVPPFSVLPFCFSDGRACRLDNRLPDPFEADPLNSEWTEGLDREEGGGLDAVLGKVFSVHLHNQWTKTFPRDGWVERLLLRRYNEKLGLEEST